MLSVVGPAAVAGSLNRTWHLFVGTQLVPGATRTLANASAFHLSVWLLLVMDRAATGPFPPITLNVLELALCHMKTPSAPNAPVLP